MGQSCPTTIRARHNIQLHRQQLQQQIRPIHAQWSQFPFRQKLPLRPPLSFMTKNNINKIKLLRNTLLLCLHSELICFRNHKSNTADRVVSGTFYGF